MKTIHICLLVIFIAFNHINTATAQNAESQFQKGIMAEEGEGNLKKAIDIYYLIANDESVEREIRARALLQIGVCYEKLGNENARVTYQKLISEYSDQKTIVTLGREKLNDLKAESSVVRKKGIVVSEVWDHAQDAHGVSPNGRYINYIDWENISINIKDLKTGKSRVISKVGTWIKPNQFPDKSIWSPDGKKLAYYWFVGNETELHIVNFDGSSDKIIVKGKNKTTPWPVTWTPDGKHILAITTENIKNSKKHKMVQVAINDGSVKVLMDYQDKSCGGSIGVSPDNKYIVYDIQQKENSKQNDIYLLSRDGKTNKLLVGDLANDTSPFWSPNGKEILFVSNRYGTNDMWRLKVENGNAVGPAETVKVDLGSRNRILGVSKDKAILYGTTNSRIDVYIASMDAASKNSSKPVKISSFDSKRNINAVWSPNGQLVSYTRFSHYRENVLGHKQQFTIYDVKTETKENIDTDLFGNVIMYRPKWSLDSRKLLIHGLIKDNYQGGLFMYDVNTNNKTPIKVADNMSEGKINDDYRSHTFSNDNKSIFYFSNDKKSILNYTISSKHETTVLTGSKTLNYFRLSNDNKKIAFGYYSDQNLYSLLINGGEKKSIMKSPDCNCSDSVISWGMDDSYLYFKKGEFRNFKKLMRISADGGEPEEVLNFKDLFENGTVTQVNIHPDEDKLLVELEVGGESVWKLEGAFNE